MGLNSILLSIFSIDLFIVRIRSRTGTLVRVCIQLVRVVAKWVFAGQRACRTDHAAERNNGMPGFNATRRPALRSFPRAFWNLSLQPRECELRSNNSEQPFCGGFSVMLCSREGGTLGDGCGAAVTSLMTSDAFIKRFKVCTCGQNGEAA